MSRRCELTGVQVQYGNNVSHSHRKTRRTFLPNIRSISYRSDLTGCSYRLKIVARTIRTIEKYGSFDEFMLLTDSDSMSQKAKKIKRDIINKKKQ